MEAIPKYPVGAKIRFQQKNEIIEGKITMIVPVSHYNLVYFVSTGEGTDDIIVREEEIIG